MAFSHRVGDKAFWLCRCDCGADSVARLTQLRNGRTTSCGCRLREINAAFGPPVIHGLSRSRIFRIWHGMQQRCTNPRERAYRYYGGRGIAVCERWRTFANFAADQLVAYQAHVLAHGERETTIDRIDNDRGYEPNNCRWATRAQQHANRRPQARRAAAS